MKPKPFPFRIPGTREGPMGPPAWWLRLQRWRQEAKQLRHNRIWGVWEVMSPKAKERYMALHAGDQSHRIRTVYPSWAAVCRPVRHRRSGRGRVKMRSYRTSMTHSPPVSNTSL